MEEQKRKVWCLQFFGGAKDWRVSFPQLCEELASRFGAETRDVSRLVSGSVTIRFFSTQDKADSLRAYLEKSEPLNREVHFTLTETLIPTAQPVLYTIR